MVIIEEKVIGKGYDLNENKKDKDFKLKYYSQEYLDKKKDDVLFGMQSNQATQLGISRERSY